MSNLLCHLGGASLMTLDPILCGLELPSIKLINYVTIQDFLGAFWPLVTCQCPVWSNLVSLAIISPGCQPSQLTHYFWRTAIPLLLAIAPLRISLSFFWLVSQAYLMIFWIEFFKNSGYWIIIWMELVHKSFPNIYFWLNFVKQVLIEYSSESIFPSFKLIES